MTNLMAANQAGQSGQSARDQYYAELETLELDERMRAAVTAARKSQSQRRLLETWRRSSRTV